MQSIIASESTKLVFLPGFQTFPQARHLQFAVIPVRATFVEPQRRQVTLFCFRAGSRLRRRFSRIGLDEDIAELRGRKARPNCLRASLLKKR